MNDKKCQYLGKYITVQIYYISLQLCFLKKIPQESIEFVELIGEGSFSKVYKIYDNYEKRFYALKQTNLESVSDLKQMITETKILAQLQHDNIVKQYEAKIKDNYLNTVLELCRFSLEEMIICQKRIPCQILQLIVRQCVQGFVYLHKNKIFHRDCKPGNILIGYDNKIKITDFNAAKVVYSSLNQNTQIGSLEYQAPETLKTDYPINSKVDVFSLGLSVMTMILGKSIWYGKNSLEIIDFYMNNTKDDIIYQIFQKKCAEQKINVTGSIVEFLQRSTTVSQENRFTMTDCMNCKWLTEKKFYGIEEAKMNNIIEDTSKMLQSSHHIFFDQSNINRNVQQWRNQNNSFTEIEQMIDNI